MADLLDASLRELLDRTAAPGDPASGGVAAATACAMAAGLVTMAARSSVETWDEAAGIAAQALRLQARASELVPIAADAFAAAISALRPGEGLVRDGALGPALDAAADVPLRVCSLAADVAELASHTAAHAADDVRPDAVVAAGLATAAAYAAAHLVSVNLAVTGDDPRRQHADAATSAAREARDRAQTVEGPR